MGTPNKDVKELFSLPERFTLPRVDCFRLFKDYTMNLKGLCISTIEPADLQSKYKLGEVQFIHITDSPTMTNEILPNDLYKLKQSINIFLQSNPKSVILIDGLEQLIAQHDWALVRKFVQNLKSQCQVKFEKLLISLDSGVVNGDVLFDLKKIMSDSYVQLVIETLSNSIRREIIYYLEKNSPTTFMTILKALEIRDSPKLSFHLRKLVQNHFIDTSNDCYRLSSQGDKALTILKHLENEGLIADQNNTTIIERYLT